MPSRISSRSRQLKKAQLRSEKRAARRALEPPERAFASDRICAELFRLPVFQRAADVAVYFPMPDEVNCWRIIERGWRMNKRIFAPVLKKNAGMEFVLIEPDSKLARNKFGLLEPIAGATIEARRLDVCITPLVAFDDRGNRIGMGSGYYDRAFRFLRHRKHLFRPKLIGLAFDCQEVSRIRASSWDIQLFQVVTESGPRLAARRSTTSRSRFRAAHGVSTVTD